MTTDHQYVYQWVWYDAEANQFYISSMYTTPFFDFSGKTIVLGVL